MVFVLLVLLNMLLAVILDTYTAVSAKLAGSADAPTLWKQVAQYRQRRKATKGFMSDAAIGMSLDDPDVHPDTLVTPESLQEAYPDMKPEQVEYLLTWLTKEAVARHPTEGAEDFGPKLAGVESYLSNIAEEVGLVKMNVAACVKKINMLEETYLSPSHSSSFVKQDNAVLNESMLVLNDRVARQQGTVTDLGRAVQRLSDMTGTLTQQVEAHERSNLEVLASLKHHQVQPSVIRTPAPAALALASGCVPSSNSKTDSPVRDFVSRLRS
jgi:hypothetical protein